MAIEQVMIDLGADDPNIWLIPGAIESAVREAIEGYSSSVDNARLICVVATLKQYSNGNFVEIIVKTNADAE